jgi:hypothetical protein
MHPMLECDPFHQVFGLGYAQAGLLAKERYGFPPQTFAHQMDSEGFDGWIGLVLKQDIKP